MKGKRIAAALLAAICLLLPGGCKEEGYDILKPYFTGRVLELQDSSYLVAVTDPGNANVAVGQEILVHSDIRSYAAGDLLRISFDGKMTHSLPPQITAVIIAKEKE